MSRTNHICVVIDTMMFSSSVISLLDSGVSSIIPIHPDEDMAEYSDEFMLGSESDETDFRNSPQNIYGIFGMLETVPETVGLTSTNGAREVHEVNSTTGEDTLLLIGSLMNAKAISNVIQEHDCTYTTHPAHSRGKTAVEDVITAEVIEREISQKPIDYEEVRETVSKMPIENLVSTKNEYPWVSEEDIHHVIDINSKDIVPSYCPEQNRITEYE